MAGRKNIPTSKAYTRVDAFKLPNLLSQTHWSLNGDVNSNGGGAYEELRTCLYEKLCPDLCAHETPLWLGGNLPLVHPIPALHQCSCQYHMVL